MMACLDTLPVELLYRIFDSLDTETILTSIRYVCKRFNLITNTYNRYQLNFKSINKLIFHQLCRYANPQNVISLTLTNDNQTPGQIESFLTLCHIEQYTGLQSVTLLSIEDCYLKLIMRHLSTSCFVSSLVINCDLNSDLSMETMELLSVIIGKTSLRKLDLTLGYTTIDKLQWPTKSSIVYLKLSDAIELQQFCTILSCSPNLQTMILRDCSIYSNEDCNGLLSDSIPFPQLTSLTLEDSELELTLIDSLLSLVPSLVNFKIKSYIADLFDGTRWEQLIQTKLPNLINIQFAFQSNAIVSNDSTGLESLITSFQTPFWLENKQWFVTALCNKNSRMINLYTIQDCAPKITYGPKANKIMCSTAPKTIKDVITMDNVRELSLDLIEMQADANAFETRRLFNKITKLILQLNGDWPINALELLSSLIDLSTVVDLELNFDFTTGNILNITNGIDALLEKTINIYSLIVFFRPVPVETIYIMTITHRIRHLQIPINNIEEMKIILNEPYYLSSVTFKLPNQPIIAIEDILTWLSETHRDFTYQSSHSSLSLWLGQKLKSDRE